MSKLVAINPGLAGLSYELGTRWVTIGRGDKNTFQIVETSVSSQHCEVLLRGDELVVRDLRSTNGTFIDGRTIAEAVLRPGQTLRLGEVELRLEITAPVPSVASPAPAPAPIKKSKAAGGTQKHYRVLFVDDSMAFLEMITDLFGAREEITWEILTATSPDKALAILQQKLIDLVVLDIGMPLLDGIQLLGLIHQRYPNIKKVALTGESDDRHRAACLANGAELFLLKPADEDGWRLIFNLLTSLLRWEDSNDFVSTLSETGLYNVIQLECLGGNSSVLEVRNQQTAGEIYIEGGAIVHAAAGKLVGEKAFHQLLSLTDGEFRVIPFQAPPARTVQRQWEALLAETARVRDEEKFSADDDGTILITKKRPPTGPPPTTQPVPAPEVKEPPPKPIPDEPPKPKAAPSTSGMNVITLEEMVEADTTLISKPGGKAHPPADPKK
ncbi:MAG: response regulator [Limisphaerales bacterium]